MIQLRKIQKNLGNIALTPNIGFKSHQELLSNWKSVTEKLKGAERENIFFTPYETTPDEKVTFKKQSALFIDIDLPKDITYESLEPNAKHYLESVASALEIHDRHFLVIFSGHGFHFLLQTKNLDLKSKEDFVAYRAEYKRVCDKINEFLKIKKMPGETDSNVFAPKFHVRMPGTFNAKEDLPRVPVRLLQPGDFQAVELKWQKEEPAPKKEKKEKSDFISEVSLQNIKLDEGFIEENCRFLNFAKKNPERLNEPLWYAQLGILKHFKEARKVIHERSKNHPKYSESETDEKIANAEGIKPRTCEGIAAIWGESNCRKCKYFGKVKSPVALKSRDFISSEDNGFYRVADNGKLVPQYDDVRKFLARELNLKVHNKTGQFYSYQKSHYEPFSTTQMKAEIRAAFSPQPMDTVVSEVISRTKGYKRYLVDQEFFEEKKPQINLKNGIFDLGSNALLPHSEKKGFRYCLPYDYEADAKCPRFDQFLKDVTEGDEELQTLLTEFMGFVLCDREYLHQTSLLLYGHGANGKSTFMRICELLVGEKNYSSISLDEIHKPFVVDNLEGKLLNICDELPRTNLKNVNLLKKVTGGKLYAEEKGKPGREFFNVAKFIFACNELPPSSDTTDGFLRRLLIVPFRATFSAKNKNRNPYLKKELEKELSGIFNKAIDAYRKVMERGDFITSAAADEEKAEYNEAINWVWVWFNSEFEVLSEWDDTYGSRDFILKDDIYDLYVQEAERSREKPMTKRMFFNYIRARLPFYREREKQTFMEGKRPRAYYGIRRRGDAPNLRPLQSYSQTTQI